MTTNDPVVILAAKRTPIGDFQGSLASIKATELGSTAIKGLFSDSSIEPQRIDQVFMGCVLSAGLGQAPARQASLGADLPISATCTTINKMCGSGMQTIIQAYDSLVSQQQNFIVAGGMENMSQAPYLLPKARAGYRLGHQTTLDHLMHDGLEDAYNENQSMGMLAEKCAQKYRFSKQEQDTFSLESLSKANEAIKNGYFKAEITPVRVVNRKVTQTIDQDSGPLKAKADKIPLLRPVFTPSGTITAATASFISDGAAAVLLSRQSVAERHHEVIQATICAHHTHAQEPDWFTTAPIHAIEGVLKKAGWNKADVDLFEINEAFAVVTMAAITELQLDPKRVNIHGGACVLGHPIGASGARIVVTLIHALKQRNLKKGIACLCIGGGEASALAIELY